MDEVGRTELVRAGRIRLRAKDVMTSPVITVRPDTPIKDVAALMAAHHISGVPVVTDQGELVGIITEADLLLAEARGFRRPARLAPVGEARPRLRARDLMTSPVVTVDEEAPLSEVASLMVRRQINRVPVMRGGRLVGIVSRADIVRALARSDEEIAAAVRESLLHDLWVDTSRLTVEVRQGVVILEGEVDRWSEKQLVERWVAAADGVVGVENRLTYRFDDRRASLGDLWPEPRVGGAR
ncbi:MAG: CBS domain-containing protein [Armatimonadota bacterium]|nr:CBS domain-containing protein [Armatimonadota bacterium]MDR7436936.1 CBS domain-containing protein [Armatimonadota bacterium]MDR7472290.1 CBS domain-containing protein [Armatimonadota bacterium]MDR7506751.1 CBS domain-containing protein [Armatimonadota bacterium]MDR7508378.1 CBS domain-containing protein [Armatimonadota bacterium]